MHPFLPVLSALFLLAADAMAVFYHFNANHPEVAAHVNSVRTVVLLCLLIGGGLAFWLRRFGTLYPTWVAILSFTWVLAWRFI